MLACPRTISGSALLARGWKASPQSLSPTQPARPCTKRRKHALYSIYATRSLLSSPCLSALRLPPCSAASAGALAFDGTPEPQVSSNPLLSTQYDKEIVSVALPALVAMLLEPCMGAISSALIGQIGTQELGAVSVGSLSVSFCTFLFSFLIFLTTPEIAGAVAQNDPDKVSKIASKAMWVGGCCGLFTSILTVLGAEVIVGYLNPPEPAVAAYAVEFIRVRACGIVPALVGYVAVAVFRGHRDTKTPLYAAGIAAVCSLSLNLLFLYGFGWGVFGAALATTIASTVSCLSLVWLLLHKGMVKMPDLLVPPTLAAVAPMLRAGMPLAARNVISFGMVLYASMLCVRAGSAYQASFEIVRQVWILTIQFFECLNVATQSLCATYLGSGDTVRARAVMLRLVALSTLIGGAMGIAVFAGQVPLTRVFTSDMTVIQQVLLTLPVVAVFLPLDALASIMDGSLMAAKQTDYLSYIQIAGAVLQYFALAYLSNNNMISALSIWSCLKMLTVFRLVGGVSRNFGSSSKNAYKVHGTQAPPAASSLAVLAEVGDEALSITAKMVLHSTEGSPGDQQGRRQPAPASIMDADCGAEPNTTSACEEPSPALSEAEHVPMLAVVGAWRDEASAEQAGTRVKGASGLYVATSDGEVFELHADAPATSESRRP